MTTATSKKKDAAKAGTSPRHVQSEPTKDQEMNKATNTTPAASGPHKALGLAIYDACTTANNIADLLGFIARTAKTCAYNSDTEEYLRFHEIRMMIEGAGRMLNDHVEVLDGLSIDVGALGAAEARP